MAGTKTEYPALLASLQPTQAVNVLNSRIRQIHRINEDISEWLAERRKVEETYAAGLNRLAGQRAELGVELGIFKQSWTSIVSGTGSLAEAHYAFAQRIKADVESPLKDQKRDLQSMNSLQSNLASMARDLEKAQKKSGSTEEANSQWESQAPYVFEQLQTLDETRVNQTREALTQLQTHEIDCHERSKTSAESGLNALLNVDTPEEVSAFVARTSSEMPPSAPAPTSAASPEAARPSTGARTRAGTSRSEREMTGAAALAPPNPRRDTDQRSEISAAGDDAPKEKKSRLSGLRRLGTVMSRRKDKERLDEKPPRKSRNPLRRGSSNQAQLPSAGNSTTDLPANLTRRTSAQDDRSVAVDDTPLPNGPTEATAAEAATAAAATTAVAASAATAASASNSASAGVAQPTQQSLPVVNGQPASTTVPQIGVRPPSTIVEEGSAAAALADMERAQQEASAQEGDSAINLNIRDKPIQEESTDQQAAAMANVTNALRASVVPPPARRSGTLRGRRDVRNTMFVPNPTTDSPLVTDSTTTAAAAPSSLVTSPLSAAATSPIMPLEHRSTDTQSIRSAHSLASTAGAGPIRHPDMPEPGLQASIVETSSATFKDGVVSKAVVIGEVALVHNGSIGGASSSSASTTPHVRLDNFSVLEKVAPNPAFVSQISNRPGEYNVDLAQLAKTSVAFKYQVHLGEAAVASYAPLHISPAHRISANQADVLINYSLNPVFSAAAAGTPLTLANVVIILTLEGAKAASCQLKPSDGVFHKDRNMIYWRLGDVSLDPAGAPGKLLARFATDVEAKGSTVEARWELKGAGSALGLSVLGETAAAAAAASSSTVPGASAGTSADPFSDAGASSTSLEPAREVPAVRRLISGRYFAS